MNKVSMDAMNKGWALGFGTTLAPRHDDYDLLATYRAQDAAKAEKPVRKQSSIDFAAMIHDFVASLSMRRALKNMFVQ